jgi:hypothetical protein
MSFTVGIILWNSRIAWPSAERKATPAGAVAMHAENVNVNAANRNGSME